MNPTSELVIQAESVLSLNDLRQSIIQAAQADKRFVSDTWCYDIIRDEAKDTWAAVIKGRDKKLQQVSFTIDAATQDVKFGDEMIEAKDVYLDNNKDYCYNGEIVQAGGPGSGPRPGNSERYEKRAAEASQATDTAANAESDANKSRTITSHRSAAYAHSTAAKLHQRAVMAAEQAGMKQEGNGHLHEANLHYRAAVEQHEYADSAKASNQHTMKNKITAHAADEITLNDLQSAVCQAAQDDSRFQSDDNSNCKSCWCCDIIRDEDQDEWSAIISAGDGKMYEVPFTIDEDDGSVTLGPEASAVNRKTMYVASIGKSYHFNGIPVKAAGKTPSDDAGQADRKTKLAKTASKAALEASLEAHDSDEDDLHNAAKSAHEEASDAHYDAMTAHAKVDNDDEAKSHAKTMAAHDAAACAHGGDDDEDIKASVQAVRDIVKAAGNSDGAMNGHANRKSDAANQASQDAHEASAKALETDSDEDHNNAKGAHEAAADKHYAAMDAHIRTGNDQHAKDHLNAIIAHKATAEAHCRGDSEEITASIKVLKDAIKAHWKDFEKKVVKLNSGAVLAQLKGNGATVHAHSKENILHCRAVGTKISASKDWEQGQPVTFCYMPAGVSTITAGFRDKAINISVEVDEDAANIIQSSFEGLLSEAPKQKPFGDIEHKEEEASLHPVSFAWGQYDDTDGVLMTAEPTALGAKNVNGKIHRSWSPSFATDADYSKAKERNGVMTFPEGVRGSTSNPARITGIDFCVGTLTNKPAFRNMPPVKARVPKHPASKNGHKLTAEEVLASLPKPEKLTKETVLAQLKQQ